MKLRCIPFLTDYYITKNGDVYLSKKNSDPIKIQPYFDSYWKIDIEKLSYRLDYLILRTFIGIIDLPIHYKNENKHDCSFENLEYQVDTIEFNGDDILYINNTSIMFKRIKNTDDFISSNGVLYSTFLRRFKSIAHRKNGYHAHQICVSGNTMKKYTHRLVYETWIGPIEDGYVIDHVDGHKWNNDILNLEMVTSGENIVRAFKLDLQPKIWSDESIKLICRMMEKNYNKNEICDLLDIPISNKNERRSVSSLICRLKNGSTRKDITSNYDLSKYDNSSHKFKVLSNKDETIIQNLDIRGFGPTEISKITGINRTTISSNLRKRKELSA